MVEYFRKEINYSALSKYPSEEISSDLRRQQQQQTASQSFRDLLVAACATRTSKHTCGFLVTSLYTSIISFQRFG